MSKKNKKSKVVGRRTTTQPTRTTPKSKAINPIVIGLVSLTMLVVLGAGVFSGIAPNTNSSASNAAQTSSGPGNPTNSIDPNEQRRITNLEQTLQTDPNNLGVLIELGNSYYDSKQFGRAIDPYNKALDLDPNNTNVMVDLGTSYLSLGMTSQAAKEYRKALEIDPQKPQAHLNLGNALVSDNPPNVDEALSEWQKAIQLAQGDPNTIKLAQDQINKYKK